MEKPTYKLVGAPCGHHGQYTFYKALRITIGDKERIVAIGDFFFVRIWQDSELVSVGELQLLWTDRVSDQTLVSLRLYFLPENTPDGRGQHGQDEVLAINDKVVVRADDLLSWVSAGAGWRWGLRAVWRGACVPPSEGTPTHPLHHTGLDFSDVDNEKSTLDDTDSPGVVVFSYPRYCRYRALIARLEGLEVDWLRDSLVAALGGYSAPTTNTRILYCKDTFEYPELEGHEFVCNELAPKLKGRPRGRRRRVSPTSGSPATDSDPEPQTPRRLSLRNGAEKPSPSEDEEDVRRESAEDRAFLSRLRNFHRERGDVYPFKDNSLRSLYMKVKSRGGYEAVCRRGLWTTAGSKTHYERYLLPFEKHEHRSARNGARVANGRLEPRTVATIELRDSAPATPTGELDNTQIDHETGEVKEELNLVSKPAEELNREFLESLPKEDKERTPKDEKSEQKNREVDPLVVKKLFEDTPRSDEKDDKLKNDVKHNIGNTELNLTKDVNTNSPLSALLAIDKTLSETNVKSSRPAGKSSLRAVRVKPARPANPPVSTPSRTSPAAVTNFGIHRPPLTTHSDDEIIEVPYKPKTPEIIDLDEYPESPQSIKKKKLDILKERGLEVTAVPPIWPLPPNPPLITPTPVLITPNLQHQIVTQAQLFQMYNIIPQNMNGYQPPKVIQPPSIFGCSSHEKTVYGNPKDPFMPPPHVLQGTPLKPTRTLQTPNPPQDILDLTCKMSQVPKATVEIVRVPTSSPIKSSVQNLGKNYTLVDGKAVVGSNLEITLVSPKSQGSKSSGNGRPPQKRSSNGKFVSTKSPAPSNDHRGIPSPSGMKKNPIVVPNYQFNARDDASANTSGLGAYGALCGLGFDPRQLAAYRHALATQLSGYSGLLSMGAANGTPTTKN